MRHLVSTHSSLGIRLLCSSSQDSRSALLRFSAASLNLRPVQETSGRSGQWGRLVCEPRPQTHVRILVQSQQGTGSGVEEPHGAAEQVRVAMWGTNGAAQDLLGLVCMLLRLQPQSCGWARKEVLGFLIGPRNHFARYLPSGFGRGKALWGYPMLGEWQLCWHLGTNRPQAGFRRCWE